MPESLLIIIYDLFDFQWRKMSQIKWARQQGFIKYSLVLLNTIVLLSFSWVLNFSIVKSTHLFGLTVFIKLVAAEEKWAFLLNSTKSLIRLKRLKEKKITLSCLSRSCDNFFIVWIYWTFLFRLFPCTEVVAAQRNLRWI